MRCPTCQQTLAPKPVAGIELDACKGCGGFWFDDGEVLRLVSRLKNAPEVPELDLKLLLRRPDAAPLAPERSCPRCGADLQPFNYCYDSNVFLDRCQDCRGIWMDGGELNRVLSYAKGNRTMTELGHAIAEHMRERDAWSGSGVGFEDDAEGLREVWSAILGGVAVILRRLPK